MHKCLPQYMRLQHLNVLDSFCYEYIQKMTITRKESHQVHQLLKNSFGEVNNTLDKQQRT
jgi:hypothetical protein